KCENRTARQPPLSHSSSSALASHKSAVSKPSVNQPYTSASSVRASSRQPQSLGRGNLGQEGFHQGGLADAGLATDEHHAPLAALRLGDPGLELAQLRLAADHPARWQRLRGGRSRRMGRRLLEHADEAIAAPVHSLDILRRLRLVPQYPAQLADAHRQHALARRQPRPYRLQQLLFLHHPTRTCEQIPQDGEALGPQVYGFLPTPESLVAPMQLKGSKPHLLDALHNSPRRR